jgi:hypothetical protein
MAEETGGGSYEKDSTQLREAFQSIAEDLKYQYLLGFYPRNTKTGAARIRVTVDRDELFLRTKKARFLRNKIENSFHRGASVSGWETRADLFFQKILTVAQKPRFMIPITIKQTYKAIKIHGTKISICVNGR